MRLEELIKKREQELRIIKNTLGLGFPLVEERKMLRVSFLELELADLYILRYDQPTLNENQMIVLDYLKRQAPTGKPLQVIFWLMNTVAWDKLDELRNPIMHLTNKEQAQVLQAFATWVEQEEE